VKPYPSSQFLHNGEPRVIAPAVSPAGALHPAGATSGACRLPQKI